MRRSRVSLPTKPFGATLPPITAPTSTATRPARVNPNPGSERSTIAYTWTNSTSTIGPVKPASQGLRPSPQTLLRPSRNLTSSVGRHRLGRELLKKRRNNIPLRCTVVSATTRIAKPQAPLTSTRAPVTDPSRTVPQQQQQQQQPHSHRTRRRGYSAASCHGHRSVAAAATLHPPSARGNGNQTYLLQSPFRRLGASGSATTSAASHGPRTRLWNPTNSTPRAPESSRKRRPSTPPPPAVPLEHPSFDNSAAVGESSGKTGGDYPLLTLPELRQTRHSLSTRASLQIERAGSSDHRISLPRSIRISYDGSRSQSQNPSPALVYHEGSEEETPVKLDKGKGKAVMAGTPENEDPSRSFSKDLERGPDVVDPRLSNVSAGDGIGSALSSSNSSIMGEDIQADIGEEWGPQHPCYPHLNPHVPTDSPEYVTTRIIRVRRDWLMQGDLAPTFSNLYPEILDPAGLPEQEFRRVIEKLNSVLVPAYNPYSARNVFDGFMGVVTGWLWDDFGMTAMKSRLNNLEQWLENWNSEMDKTASSEEGAVPPKLVPLRRTGYMTLDIQIPDPEIAPAPSSHGPGESRTALPLEPAMALTA